MIDDRYKPSKEEKSSILEYLRSLTPLISSQSSEISRLETLDRYYWREYLHHKKIYMAQRKHLSQSTPPAQSDFLIEDVEIPVTFKHVETATAFYSQLFLGQYPIFQPVSQPAFVQVNEALEAVYIDHAVQGKWAGNGIKFLRDVVKYNKGFLEVVWDEKNTFSAVVDPVQGMKREAKVWEGNRLNWLNAYNSFYDYRVDPSELQEYGEFAGYSEIWSYVRLKQEYAKLGKNTLAPISDYIGNRGMLGIRNVGSDYYTPDVTISLDTANRGFNWSSFFGSSSSIAAADSNKIKAAGISKTFYCRLVPKDLNLKVPEAGTPQIWKFVVYGDQLFSVKRQSNAHDWLPVIIGQLHSDSTGSQAKSIGELVTPFQQAETGLLAAKISSSRRALTDRAIYNPYFLSDAVVNNPTPNAKLKIRNHAYNTSLDNVYRPIPYEDRAAAGYLQDIGVLDRMANDSIGINDALQGQFVRGNKSLHEFESIMGNASARLELGAQFLESHAFGPVKEILKVNVLQYQKSVPLWNAQQGSYTEIPMEDIRQSGFGYKLASGLNPAAKLLGLDFLKEYLTMVAQIPQYQQKVDITKLANYIISLSTNVDLNQFNYTPEEMQAMQQQAVAQQAALEAAKGGATGVPENVG